MMMEDVPQKLRFGDTLSCLYMGQTQQQTCYGVPKTQSDISLLTGKRKENTTVRPSQTKSTEKLVITPSPKNKSTSPLKGTWLGKFLKAWPSKPNNERPFQPGSDEETFARELIKINVHNFICEIKRHIFNNETFRRQRTGIMKIVLQEGVLKHSEIYPLPDDERSFLQLYDKEKEDEGIQVFIKIIIDNLFAKEPQGAAFEMLITKRKLSKDTIGWIINKTLVQAATKGYLVKQALTATIPILYNECHTSEKAWDLPRIRINKLTPTDFLDNVKLNPKQAYAAPNLGLESNAPSQMVYGASINTYPPDPTSDIIADSYLLRVYENQKHFIIVDGCNWGIWSARAAIDAINGFYNYIDKKFLSALPELETSQEYASTLLKATCAAHDAIINNHKRYLQDNSQYDLDTPPGTTTLLGGCLLQTDQALRNSDEPQFVGIFVSVGDCKGYRLSTEGELTDLTKATRPDGLSAMDPGGRLGPYTLGSCPDLRNLWVIFVPFRSGDKIILMTDGVHDNLDPVMLGHDSKEYGFESWEKLQSMRQSSQLLDNWKEQIGAEVLKNAKATSAKEITDALLDHCMRITHSSREWMANNPSRRLPIDFKQFPGKMDHCTCLTIAVE